MPEICLGCIHDQGICKNLLYRKWHAYLRDACTLYSTLMDQLGITQVSKEVRRAQRKANKTDE